MDCIEGMQSMSADTVDLIITDPPFGIEFKARRANYNRTASRVIEGYNDVARDDYYQFSLDWIRQAHRILKASGSMYLFSGWNQLRDILNALQETGFQLVNHIIWKYQFGVVTKKRFVTSHYHCLLVCKDDKQRKFFPFARYEQAARDEKGRSLHYRDKEDVWYIKREYWNGDHKTPTKLPAEIIRKILAYSSQEGELVCDPFLGSGQVAVISKLEKRHYIGFEINREYYNFAKTRLERNLYRLRAEKNSQLSLC